MQYVGIIWNFFSSLSFQSPTPFPLFLSLFFLSPSLEIASRVLQASLKLCRRELLPQEGEVTGACSRCWCVIQWIERGFLDARRSCFHLNYFSDISEHGTMSHAHRSDALSNLSLATHCDSVIATDLGAVSFSSSQFQRSS